MNQDARHTIRLLIVGSEASEAEALLNIYRDAGHATRGQHITSENTFEEALTVHRQWDLVLVAELPDELTLSFLLDTIAQQGRDIPVVVLSEDADASEVMELIQSGVRAVVPKDSDDYLLLATNREIEDLRIRRHYRKMNVALNESEKQRRMLLNDQFDAIVYISEGTIRYANPAFRQLIGVEEKETIEGQLFKKLVTASDSEMVGEFLDNVEESGQAVAAIQCPLMVSGGFEQPVRAVISPTSFEGEYTLSVLIRPEQPVEEGQDTEQSESPGLIDKPRFQEQLDVAIQRAVAGKGSAALMCLSLDTLKAIHEKGGRQFSQLMLLAVAKKLGNLLSEKHQVASWGNGIFMVLLAVEEKKQVQLIADDILEQVAGDIEVGNHKLPARFSMGAVLLNDASNDPKTLLVRTRHAANQSLKEGGGKLSFYQKRKINVVSSVEKHLAGMVSQALKSDSLQLMYQPVVSLKGSPEEYYEVFLRMKDVRGREHEAASFRAKLDKNRLWSKVDRWQLIQASKDLMAKRKSGHDTRLILHLGACAITDEGFLPWMGVALKAAGIPYKAVALELSEPNLVRFKKEVALFFKGIKELGCQTVVSDFGCSLNPLDNIKPLDVDLVRVDPSFTKDLTSADKGEELEKIIAALVRKRCKIIVPQVESAAEMAPLWQSGVDYIQGPFLQNPSESMTFDFGSDM